MATLKLICGVCGIASSAISLIFNSPPAEAIAQRIHSWNHFGFLLCGALCLVSVIFGFMRPAAVLKNGNLTLSPNLLTRWREFIIRFDKITKVEIVRPYIAIVYYRAETFDEEIRIAGDPSDLENLKKLVEAKNS